MAPVQITSGLYVGDLGSLKEASTCGITHVMVRCSSPLIEAIGGHLWCCLQYVLFCTARKPTSALFKMVFDPKLLLCRSAAQAGGDGGVHCECLRVCE